LGLPVAAIEHVRNGASAVVLAPAELDNPSDSWPQFSGIAEAASEPGTDLRLFGKPSIRPYRRMAVALSFGEKDDDIGALVSTAKRVASMVQVKG
jgi:phosphoribosylglycinamide formyltransferase 2